MVVLSLGEWPCNRVVAAKKPPNSAVLEEGAGWPSCSEPEESTAKLDNDALRCMFLRLLLSPSEHQPPLQSRGSATGLCRHVTQHATPHPPVVGVVVRTVTVVGLERTDE